MKFVKELLRPCKPFLELCAVVALCLSAFSCNSDLTPRQYVFYFEKNRDRFSAKIERNGAVATVTFTPKEYFAARTMTFDTTMALQQALIPYKNSLFIVINLENQAGKKVGNISTKSVKSGLLPVQNVNNSDIFVTINGDTVKATSVTREKAWRIMSGNSIVAAFDEKRIATSGSKGVLHVRNISDELGTMEIPLKKLMTRARSLKG
jgi:hypothetical protein